MSAYVSVFDFQSYKRFLEEILSQAPFGRGAKSRLSERLNCRTAFISQVIHGSHHFSLEHALIVAEFLSLNESEVDYFVNLVLLEKAGTEKLRKYHQQKLGQILKAREKERLKVQSTTTLSNQDQIQYCSSWHYSVIHIMLSIPRFQNPRAIAEYLNLPLELVMEHLEFLLNTGLAKKEKGRFVLGESRLHLKPDSPIAAKQHASWRVKAIEKIDQRRPANLHYSLVMSLSEEDFGKIRSLLLKALEDVEPILGPSKEEKVVGLMLDYFEI